jgi:hypothetical protein
MLEGGVGDLVDGLVDGLLDDLVDDLLDIPRSVMGGGVGCLASRRVCTRCPVV